METVLAFLEKIGNYLLLVRFTDILDVIIIAFLVYKLLDLVRSTRAENILKGVVIFLLALWLSEIFHLYDCVIVESFGVGGIPQQRMDAFAEGLGDYDKTRKVLILTTQVTYEGSDVGVYEVGKRVKNLFRFLEAHDMTIEAVVTKSMWLLAQNCDSFDQLQQRFYRQINFDTFYH